MSTPDARNLGPGTADQNPERPGRPGPGKVDPIDEETPVEYTADSDRDYPREVDYGDQETRYLNKRGRGYGDAGYGYGGEAGLGASGGSDVRN